MISISRHKQLESILVVTQQFHETLEPLSEWLSATEKHLANSEPIGTETSKLEDQISQHKVISIIFHHFHLFSCFFLNYQLSSLQFYSFCLLLVSLRFSLFPIHLSKFQLNIFYHVFVFCLSCFLGPFPIPCRQALEEEIMNHSKDLFQAVNLGQMLKTVSSVDDKEFVQSKLDTAQASYIELQERCRRKAEMLQQALANAQLFGEDEVALMNWLNEIHTRLSEVSVEDYRLEVLEKQLADQRVYTPPQATHFVALSFKLHQSCFSLFCSFVCHHRNISCYSQ